MDTEGNLYATAGSAATSGIYIFAPDGKHLAKIPLPADPTNCQFGIGKELSTLYITAGIPGKEKNTMGAFGLYRIGVLKQGRHAATEKAGK